MWYCVLCRAKTESLDAILARNADKSESAKFVTVYKLGDFVDMTEGPLIANTSQIGRFNLTAIHNVESPRLGTMQRIQAISIPSQLNVSYFTAIINL